MRGHPTTAWRVILAVLVGVLLPACLSLGWSEVQGLGDLSSIPPEFRPLFVLAAVVKSALLLLFPGSVVWAICHRIRASLWIAGLGGALTGAMSMAAFTWITMAPVARAWGEDFGAVAVAAGETAVFGAFTGGLTAIAIWLVAYPKSLRPPAPAEAF